MKLRLRLMIFSVSLIMGYTIYTEKIWFDNRTTKSLVLEEHIGGSTTNPVLIRPMGTIAAGQIISKNVPDGRLYIGNPEVRGSYQLLSRETIQRLASECGNELAVILTHSHLKGQFSSQIGCARNGLLGEKKRSK